MPEIANPASPLVLVLTQGGPNPEILINALKKHFPNLTVVVEEPEAKSLFIRRRARKLGWVQALGQLATMVVSKYGKRFTARRFDEIVREYGADPSVDPNLRRIAIGSANTPEFAALVKELRVMEDQNGGRPVILGHKGQGHVRFAFGHGDPLPTE